MLTLRFSDFYNFSYPHAYMFTRLCLEKNQIIDGISIFKLLKGLNPVMAPGRRPDSTSPSKIWLKNWLCHWYSSCKSRCRIGKYQRIGSRPMLPPSLKKARNLSGQSTDPSTSNMSHCLHLHHAPYPVSFTTSCTTNSMVSEKHVPAKHSPFFTWHHRKHAQCYRIL